MKTLVIMGYNAIYTMNTNFTSKYGEKEVKMNSYNSIKITANTLKNRKSNSGPLRYLQSQLWTMHESASSGHLGNG